MSEMTRSGVQEWPCRPPITYPAAGLCTPGPPGPWCLPAALPGRQPLAQGAASSPEPGDANMLRDHVKKGKLPGALISRDPRLPFFIDKIVRLIYG